VPNDDNDDDNIPPIMIINRTYETPNLVAVACFLPGRVKDLSAPLCMATVCMSNCH
jgi:hypothetical protein